MRTITRLTGAAAVALALAACGGGGDGSDDDAIASLGGETTTTAGEGDDGGGGGSRPVDDSEFQDAMLEYAECMRDEGVDFPDPQFGENGSVAIVGPGGEDGPPSEHEVEEFEAADEACQHIMEEVERTMPEPSPEEQQEMQDRALAFAECMRDHGIDMPDPTFGEGGRVEQRFEADQGIDPSGEEFQEAQEACAEEGGGGPRIGAGPGAEGGVGARPDGGDE
jgi:hypothetical protein